MNISRGPAVSPGFPVPHPGSVIKLGLTGGIGAGKSEVSRLLAARGAYVIDADELARAALEPGTAELARVVSEFGPEVLHADGSLNRKALGTLVFADPARRAALNAIVHPYVAARAAEITRRIEKSGDARAVLVYDVPLLFENGLAENYDLVLVVDASADTQLRRLVELRGMSEAEALARMAAQASREQRLAIADVVIDNDGDLADLEPQVHHLWERLTSGH